MKTLPTYLSLTECHACRKKTNTWPIIISYHLESLQHVWDCDLLKQSTQHVQIVSAFFQWRKDPSKTEIPYTVPYIHTILGDFDIQWIIRQPQVFKPMHRAEILGFSPNMSSFWSSAFHVICTSIPFVSSKMLQTELKPLPFPYLFPLKILDRSIPLGQFGGKLTTRSTPMSWEIPQAPNLRWPRWQVATPRESMGLLVGTYWMIIQIQNILMKPKMRTE